MRPDESDSSGADEPEEPTLEWLFERLEAEGRSGGDRLERARSTLRDDSPTWYFQALSFGGAWLSAGFIGLIVTSALGLCGFPADVLEHWFPWMFLGAGLLVGGIWLDGEYGESLFFGHFAGALGVAGLAGVAVGLALLGEVVLVDWLGVELESWLGVALYAGLSVSLLVTAVSLHRRADGGGLFGQLAFATSAAGQVIAVIAGQGLHGQIWPDAYEFSWAAGLLAESAAATVLYWRVESDFHRFVLGAAVNVLAVGAVFDATGDASWSDEGMRRVRRYLLVTLFALQHAVTTAAFTPNRWLPLSSRLFLRPLGYACALAIAALSSELFLLEMAEVGALWPFSGTVAVALVAMIYGAVDASEATYLEPAFWGAAAAVVLAVVSTPGVLVGLLLVGYGLWRARGWFFALGLVALGFHLVVFYYLMEVTLFEKSLMLMATGGLLLAVRIWFVQRPWYTPDTTS